MKEHRIRLRGGWLWIDPTSSDSTPRRVSLPLPGFPHESQRVILFRSFQSPPLEPDRETLWLHLQSVPGLVRLTLNEHELHEEPDHQKGLLYRIGAALPAHNRLILDVHPADAKNDQGVQASWGEVSLVIRWEDGGV